MTIHTKSLSRRGLLRDSAMLMASLVAIPIVIISPAARASKASKSDFHYQEQPREGKKCSDCAAYVASPGSNAPGACKIVDGPVNPNGWCMAYSAR
jgi:hypothetical protein